MNIRLEWKRALVTGGSSGIGTAIARTLADARAKEAFTYRSHPEAAEALLETLGQEGGETISVEADVSDPTAVKAVFERMDVAWGGIDILINNAGMMANARSVGKWIHRHGEKFSR